MDCVFTMFYQLQENKMDQKRVITKDDHSDAKGLNQLTNLLRNLPKQSILKGSSKLSSKKENDSKITDSRLGTTSRRLRKRKSTPDSPNYPKIDDYLREANCLPPVPPDKKTKDKSKVQSGTLKHKSSVVATKSGDNLNTNVSKKTKSEKKNGHSPTKQSKLDIFFNKPKNENSKKLSKKTSSKTKPGTSFKRSESSDSCELPTFKTSKKPAVRKKKEKASYKKYGIPTPSVDEILQDKKDLEEHKNQMKAFQLQPLCNTSFELPFSTKDLEKTMETDSNLLDCKNLSLIEVTRIFKKNLQYLSDIINGKVYNERHERYHDKNNKLFTLTPRDLSYSTSMIVFTFEQTEHMLGLLQNEFDPTDDKTRYFFQVLLPELCLRIFMEAHQMSLEEAVIYLEERPPVRN